MGWLDTLRSLLGFNVVRRRPGTTGRPTSSNGASSHHLFWNIATGDEPIVEVRATIEIIVPPTVPRLYFWALQASFTDGTSTFGGAHLGLQHHPEYPGAAAANWGGYHDRSRGGGILDGSALSIPSALGNANTGNFAWSPHTPYVLRIARGVQGWKGSITDPAGTEVVLRELFCDGTQLRSPLVWTEAFADCDAPTTTVRWSDLLTIDRLGTERRVSSVRTNYQSIADGGCSTSDSLAVPGGVLQQTGVERSTPQSVTLPLPPPV